MPLPTGTPLNSKLFHSWPLVFHTELHLSRWSQDHRCICSQTICHFTTSYLMSHSHKLLENNRRLNHTESAQSQLQTESSFLKTMTITAMRFCQHRSNSMPYSLNILHYSCFHAMRNVRVLFYVDFSSWGLQFTDYATQSEKGSQCLCLGCEILSEECCAGTRSSARSGNSQGLESKDCLAWGNESKINTELMKKSQLKYINITKHTESNRSLLCK